MVLIPRHSFSHRCQRNAHSMCVSPEVPFQLIERSHGSRPAQTKRVTGQDLFIHSHQHNSVDRAAVQQITDGERFATWHENVEVRCAVSELTSLHRPSLCIATKSRGLSSIAETRQNVFTDVAEFLSARHSQIYAPRLFWMTDRSPAENLRLR